MGYAQRLIPHYTYEDWKLWEGKWELHEGYPIAMSPAPVPEHQRVANNIKTEFTFALKNCEDCVVYDPIDCVIADDVIFIPDALIVCKPITKKYLDFTPALVVEVLAPSTALRDRVTKYAVYEKQGVKYYLIIDVEKRAVEIFENKNGAFEIAHISNNNFNFLLGEQGCSGNINLEEIW
ncbi:MAG: Uma2 family endonuclease [Ferruginibacter sp.]